MIKVHNIYIGSKYDFNQIPNEGWSFVHACKTFHQKRLGYSRPPKGKPYYIEFQDGNHLYLNWVDEPSGQYFQVETFINALGFIDNQFEIGNEVFIHCDQGQSRSPSLAMVYLAKRTKFLEDNYMKAYEDFVKEYPAFQPGGIIKFIQRNWEQIK